MIIIKKEKKEKKKKRGSNTSKDIILKSVMIKKSFNTFSFNVFKDFRITRKKKFSTYKNLKKRYS